MTKREANSKAVKLFNYWRKNIQEQRNATDEYYYMFNTFNNDCRKFHGVVGVYKVLTHKNALKMAAICSSVRFVEPFNMLMKLQENILENQK